MAKPLAAHQGEVRLNGERIDTLPRRRVAQQLGLLPQDHLDAFPATVLPFGSILTRLLSNGVTADVLIQALEEKFLPK